MKNGVPYDVAFSLNAADVAAYVIIFGEFENNRFNWDRMTWETRD